jgi:hypothetical protein
MDGTFALLKQRPNHVGIVSVEVEAQTQRNVFVSPNAFSWLKGAYGEKASTQNEWIETLKHEASSGVMFALAEADVGAEVTITRIEFSNIDTTVGDVQYAAAWAVWNALGHQPTNPPWVDDSGVHFPYLLG